MAEGKSFCIVAGVLAIISAVLGFAAEALNEKESNTQVGSSENNLNPLFPSGAPPNGEAVLLGFYAAFTLLIAFIFVSSAGGCFCCYKSNPCQCNAALVCFIFSWLTFVSGLSLLLAGVSMDSVRPGVFASGACLSLTSIVLGIAYYRILSLSSAHSGPHHRNANIETGQLNVPPPEPNV